MQKILVIKPNKEYIILRKTRKNQSKQAKRSRCQVGTSGLGNGASGGNDMVDLKRIGFRPDNTGVYPGVFSSAAMLIDADLPDRKTVAFVIFSSGGNIIYKHYPDYKDEELMVAAERFLGETMLANRWKVFSVTVEKAGGKT